MASRDVVASGLDLPINLDRAKAKAAAALATGFPPHSHQSVSYSVSRSYTLTSFQPASYQDELEREVRKLHKALRERQEDNINQDSVIAELQEVNRKLHLQQTQVETELRQMQESSFRSMEDARWMPLDESTIQAELLGLQSGIDRYAKAFAVKDLSHLDTEPEEMKMSLLTELAAIFRFNKKSLAALNELTAIPNVARLCLAGLLSHSIHSKIMSNPFFFMYNDFTDQESEFKTIQPILAQHPRLADFVDPSKAFLEVYETTRACTFVLPATLTLLR